MYTVLVVLQVFIGVALIGLVLIQHGKGADAGAAFGSGSSGTVFGARGAATFLTRTTAWLATFFFATSLALAYLVNERSAPASVVDRLATESAPTAVTDPVASEAAPAASGEPTPGGEVPAAAPAGEAAPEAATAEPAAPVVPE
ncbi:MAG TPA: preprotein translocase subunit SecG [Nevskiaceae bacterium]|nr:preprotein translocase subunit SecG [Nevskiaceae bacterium]